MIRRSFLYATAAFAAMPGRAFAQAEPLTTIRFAAQAGDDLRPVLYALSTGMFKQAGLDVVMQTGNGATTPQAVIAEAKATNRPLVDLANERGMSAFSLEVFMGLVYLDYTDDPDKEARGLT